MLTVDYERLGQGARERVLDVGCGGGRHAREALRRGARVTALDLADDELHSCRTSASDVGDGAAPGGSLVAVRGNVMALPFADATFDRVIAAEVLEHVADDRAAMGELARVLRPGGTLAVTVPRWFPERICWALSPAYSATPGGHIRIYRGTQLRRRLHATGLVTYARHHRHALHSPYWWLRCALRGRADTARSVRAYRRLLVWDLMQRPRLTRALDTVLNPVLGKSLVVYARRPPSERVAAGDHRAAA